MIIFSAFSHDHDPTPATPLHINLAAAPPLARPAPRPAPNRTTNTSTWHKKDPLNKTPRPKPGSSTIDKPRGRLPRSYAKERWACPPLFRPVRIPSDPADNADGVSLHELLAGEYTDALIGSFLVDINFLLDAAPRLKTVPFLLIQGVKENK